MEQKNEKIILKEAKTIYINRESGLLYDQFPIGVNPKIIRIQQDYSDVPTQTDQTQKDENNITVLMQKYKPDELAAYLAAKNLRRPEIVGHDFSQEPDLQGAKNQAYLIQKQFNELPKYIQEYFDHKPAEYLKFCENPQNHKQLKEWNLESPFTQIEEPKPTNASNANEAPAPTPT